MNDFDLRKYLADNKLLKEEVDINKISKLGDYNETEDSYKYKDYFVQKYIDGGKTIYAVFKDKGEKTDSYGNPDFESSNLKKVKDFLTENRLLKEENYTRLEDDGEKRYIDLDYDSIRAYIAGKKGQDFADDFIDGYNDEFYENVVRFLNKTKKPTDKEVTDFIDIEIGKEREEYIPAPNAPGGRGLAENKLLKENIDDLFGEYVAQWSQGNYDYDFAELKPGPVKGSLVDDFTLGPDDYDDDGYARDYKMMRDYLLKNKSYELSRDEKEGLSQFPVQFSLEDDGETIKADIYYSPKYLAMVDSDELT